MLRTPDGRRIVADGATVVLEAGVTLDAALKRLKKQVKAAQLERELRRRQAYEPPGARRRRKHRTALKREAQARRAAADG